MELRHLRYFTAVVEAKGYREASRGLHVSQPALSQTVADPESELKIKLFRRKGLQVQLTAAGEVFYKEAKRTLVQAEVAVEAARRAEKGQTGSLRIGFHPCRYTTFLAELLHIFKQQNKDISMALQSLSTKRKHRFMRERREDFSTFTNTTDRLPFKMRVYLNRFFHSSALARTQNASSISMATFSSTNPVDIPTSGPKWFGATCGKCSSLQFPVK